MWSGTGLGVSARGRKLLSRTSAAAERPDAFERRLPPQPSSVAEARQLVRALLAETHRDDLVETAVLLVSEIVTNALLHAGTAIDVAAFLDKHGLRVEVGDGSLHLPMRRNYAATAGTGRGLRLLEEMVDEWGVSRRRHGKTVWFRLSGEDAEHDGVHGRKPTGRSRAPRDLVDVELRNMPLLLHAAWHEHAEALLREFLLANLDTGRADDGARDPIQVHADATDALSLIEEHLPRIDIDLSPERLLSELTEPQITAATVHVPVPSTSLRHFRTLDETLQAAVDLSDRGHILTPSTQPEIRQFRRWICGQVATQAVGAAPDPWRPDPHEPMLMLPEADWDSESVTSASTARLAADEMNRIVAVSPAALELLGYDDPAGLVGQRIVAVIPERYRQAHVAGFTLHRLVDRRPLLGRPVVVPALRADGTEVEAEMLLTTEPAGDGRRLFVADFRPL
jgi:PAS domain S-box-containing protein